MASKADHATYRTIAALLLQYLTGVVRGPLGREGGVKPIKFAGPSAKRRERSVVLGVDF